MASLDNWAGCQADASVSINDPLVEQMNIIKGYIKQARLALRFEEVEYLEVIQLGKFNRKKNVFMFRRSKRYN